MTDLLEDWAALWGISVEALDDLALRVTIAAEPIGITPSAQSESYAQSLVRLAAPGAGMVLWRNNVGVAVDKTGRHIRYGLANDSKALNETIKSADLIGWRAETISAEQVGTRIARFVSIECKEIGWVYGKAGKDTEQGLRERAQKRWLDMVVAAGGLASFSTGGLPK